MKRSAFRKPVVLLRLAAGAGVAVLGVLLVWQLTHQDNKTAKAILRGKVVAAPVFSLPALNRPGRITLASYRGKAVVLNFWASDCIPCKKEMPRLQEASKRWPAGRVAVVGMDVLDSKSAARRFVTAHGVTYPIAYDAVASTTTPYGVAYTPTTFFIDPRGRIVKRILGPVSAADLDAEIRHALGA